MAKAHTNSVEMWSVHDGFDILFIEHKLNKIDNLFLRII